MISIPQEIVDRIIDEIAASKNGRNATLRACCVVSRAFHPRARRHLFSYIEFLVDDSANKRAKRLLGVILSNKNRELLLNIHSLTLVLETPSPTRYPRHSMIGSLYRKSKKGLHNAAGRINLWNNHMAQLLELFIKHPLRSLALRGRYKNQILYWADFSDKHYEVDFASLLTRMACNPALVSLSFKGIRQLPFYFITAPPRLCDLLLDDIGVVNIPRPGQTEGPNHFSRYLINVVNMSIVESSLFFTLPFSAIPPSFPYLTRIVISLPKEFLRIEVLRFIMACSRSLESLELLDMDPEAHRLVVDIWSPHYLTHFSALRRIKFTARSHSSEYLHLKLALFVGLLTSATSRIPICSISIELCISWPSRTITLFEPTTHRRWAALDAALSNPMLVNLSRVTVVIKLFVDETQRESFAATHNLGQYLPGLHASSSINFEPVVETLPFRIIKWPID